MPELCGPCREQWNAWLDYRLPKESPLSLRAKDARAMVDHQTARFQEWKDTIERQQAMIVEMCARNHRTGEVHGE